MYIVLIREWYVRGGQGVGLSPPAPLLPLPPLYSPSRPLSPSALLGAARASCAQNFPLSPSLPFFLPSPSSHPSFPSSHPLVSPSLPLLLFPHPPPPPHLPSLLPVPPLICVQHPSPKTPNSLLFTDAVDHLIEYKSTFKKILTTLFPTW